MSLPSDVTPDVSEAMAAMPPVPRSTGTGSRGFEQHGLMAAALVAFLGIAYIGPALTRLARKPTVRERMERRLRDARRQAEKTGNKVRKRARRLGGGTIWL